MRHAVRSLAVRACGFEIRALPGSAGPLCDSVLDKLGVSLAPPA